VLTITELVKFCLFGGPFKGEASELFITSGRCDKKALNGDKKALLQIPVDFEPNEKPNQSINQPSSIRSINGFPMRLFFVFRYLEATTFFALATKKSSPFS
jgi:hypothetical protein